MSNFIKLIKSSLLNKNSLGEPISNDPQVLQNFWNWFGDSKIVDNKGRPLVVHHYTNSSFDTFDNKYIGTNSGDEGYFGKGFYFTSENNFGKSFGKNKMDLYLYIENPFNLDNIEDKYEFLDFLERNKNKDNEHITIETQDNIDKDLETGINRSYDITIRDLNYSHIHHGILQDFSSSITEYAKWNRYDGIISDENFTEIVVFNPNQIKSVSNNTNYNLGSNSIYGGKE